MTRHTSEPHKLITAILPKSRAKELVKKLIRARGLNRVNVHYARGLGRMTPLRHRGIGETSEKAIVTVLIDAKRADEIFEYIFFSAEINRPHGGLIYQQPVNAATLFSLPGLHEEK